MGSMSWQWLFGPAHFDKSEEFEEFRYKFLIVAMVVAGALTGVFIASSYGQVNVIDTRHMVSMHVFTATSLAIWTRQLAGLVAAGLPLERALTALAEEAPDERQRELLAQLRAEVNAGSPFAKALAGMPREFVAIARDRLVAVNEAYARLKRAPDASGPDAY